MALEQPAIDIEIAYASEDEQILLTLRVAAGATVGDAIRTSGIVGRFSGAAAGCCRVGIFGRLAGAETVLKDGDRVEIYRPLHADPKDARRSRAHKKIA